MYATTKADGAQRREDLPRWPTPGNLFDEDQRSQQQQRRAQRANDIEVDRGRGTARSRARTPAESIARAHRPPFSSRRRTATSATRCSASTLDRTRRRATWAVASMTRRRTRDQHDKFRAEHRDPQMGSAASAAADDGSHWHRFSEAQHAEAAVQNAMYRWNHDSVKLKEAAAPGCGAHISVIVSSAPEHDAALSGRSSPAASAQTAAIRSTAG